jgi:hypothetical protein
MSENLESWRSGSSGKHEALSSSPTTAKNKKKKTKEKLNYFWP